jgi:hypothetical protein
MRYAKFFGVFMAVTISITANAEPTTARVEPREKVKSMKLKRAASVEAQSEARALPNAQKPAATKPGSGSQTKALVTVRECVWVMPDMGAGGGYLVEVCTEYTYDDGTLQIVEMVVVTGPNTGQVIPSWQYPGIVTTTNPGAVPPGNTAGAGALPGYGGPQSIVDVARAKPQYCRPVTETCPVWVSRVTTSPLDICAQIASPGSIGNIICNEDMQLIYLGVDHKWACAQAACS